MEMRKKAYRKEANHVGWGLIIYNIFVAIIVMIPFLSALLFGIMHENIPQGAFAFGLGLVLGYVALEYSVYQAIVFLFVIPSVVILWRERQNVREYIKENKADKKSYAVVFSSVSILLFLAIELFVAITGLQKI